MAYLDWFRPRLFQDVLESPRGLVYPLQRPGEYVSAEYVLYDEGVAPSLALEGCWSCHVTYQIGSPSGVDCRAGDVSFVRWWWGEKLSFTPQAGVFSQVT